MPAFDEREFIKSELEPDAKIDFAALRESTQELGPLRLFNGVDPYSVEIMVSPCACEEEGCTNEVVSVWRRNGLFSIQWLITPEELLDFDSLDHFRRFVVGGGLQESRGERLIIEVEAYRIFECHYSDVEPITCVCSACAAAVGEEGLWQRLLLSQLATALTERDLMLEHAKQFFGDSAEELVHAAFDAGFSSGRVFSEYKVKSYIEKYAISGLKHQRTIAKRTKAAGEKSAQMRLARINSLIGAMENLARKNPDIVRIGPDALSRIACEDAKRQDPDLWSQGTGQIAEYIGLMRRGEAGTELKRRYLRLFDKI